MVSTMPRSQQGPEQLGVVGLELRPGGHDVGDEQPRHGGRREALVALVVTVTVLVLGTEDLDLAGVGQSEVREARLVMIDPQAQDVAEEADGLGVAVRVRPHDDDAPDVHAAPPRLDDSSEPSAAHRV